MNSICGLRMVILERWIDARRASNGHGLGLTSMKERLRLVNGEYAV